MEEIILQDSFEDVSNPNKFFRFTSAPTNLGALEEANYRDLPTTTDASIVRTGQRALISSSDENIMSIAFISKRFFMEFGYTYDITFYARLSGYFGSSSQGSTSGTTISLGLVSEDGTFEYNINDGTPVQLSQEYQKISLKINSSFTGDVFILIGHTASNEPIGRTAIVIDDFLITRHKTTNISGSFETGDEGWMVDVSGFGWMPLWRTGGSPRTGNFSGAVGEWYGFYNAVLRLPVEPNSAIDASIWLAGGKFNNSTTPQNAVVKLIGTRDGLPYGNTETVLNSTTAPIDVGVTNYKNVRVSANSLDFEYVYLLVNSGGGNIDVVFDDYDVSWSPATNTFAKDNNVWKPAEKYVNHNGVWKPASTKVKHNGVWKDV